MEICSSGTVKYGNQKLYSDSVGTNQSEDVLCAEFKDAKLLMYVVTLMILTHFTLISLK